MIQYTLDQIISFSLVADHGSFAKQHEQVVKTEQRLANMLVI